MVFYEYQRGSYADELREYQKETEAKWDAKRESDLRFKAADLGCEGNLALARYVERLEQRITQLEQKLA